VDIVAGAITVEVASTFADVGLADTLVAVVLISRGTGVAIAIGRVFHAGRTGTFASTVF